MRGQLSIEYLAAILAWVSVCLMVGNAIGTYTSTLMDQKEITAYGGYIQYVGRAGGAAQYAEGMRYEERQLLIDGNITFNNTLAWLVVGDSEYITDLGVRVGYSDSFARGDRILMRERAGAIEAVKVS